MNTRLEIPSLTELGFPDTVVETIDSHKEGLILVVGITGSGKTTTVASLREHLAEKYRVFSLEDSIEFVHDNDNVLQRDVSSFNGDYDKAWADIISTNPTVLVIDGIYDKERVNLALSAIEAGYYVIATHYADNAENIVEDLMSILPKRYISQAHQVVSNTFVMGIHQKLTRSETGRNLECEILVSNNSPA